MLCRLASTPAGWHLVVIPYTVLPLTGQPTPEQAHSSTRPSAEAA